MALAFHKAGLEVQVLTSSHPQRPERDEYQGVPIDRLDVLNPENLTSLDRVHLIRSQLRQAVQRLRPDLFHFHGTHPVFAFHFARLIKTRPSLLTLHGPVAIPAKRVTEALKAFLREFNWIACCSSWTLGHLRALLPETESRSCVALNALPLDPSEPSWEGERSRQLLIAGRLAPEKGLDLAIESLLHLPEGFRLQVAGSGQQRSELEALVERLHLGSRVHFLGELPTPELQKLFRSSLATLVPSRHEGFGLIALEATWAGCPVVASRVGGLPEVVRDSHGGVLIAPEDPVALARAILELDERPDETRRRADRAWRAARAQFCWTSLVQQYHTLYHRLLKTPTPDSRYRRPG